MLMRGMSPMHEAASSGTAIAGFVAYNLETAQGIIAAAEETDSPVILQAGASSFKHSGWTLATMALDLARQSSGNIGVHLDHARTLAEVQRCLELGYTSVMLDGSHLPFEENVRLTSEAARRAHGVGAWIEAELGAIAGDEDVSTGAQATSMTDPQLASDFVGRTAVDVLAVAVGNVHGWTPRPPALDLELLATINDGCRLPLALHGASGLSAETLIACLDRGVAKVNVNTELRRAYLRAVSENLQTAARDDLVAHLASGRDAVCAAAVRIIHGLNRTTLATPA